jgi:hypothetical protein
MKETENTKKQQRNTSGGQTWVSLPQTPFFARVKSDAWGEMSFLLPPSVPLFSLSLSLSRVESHLLSFSAGAVWEN